MHRRRFQRWNAWRRRVYRGTQELIAGVASSFAAVPLGSILKQRRIADVVFRPMLIDGGLAVEPGGFRIYVHAHERHVASLQKRFRESDGVDIPVRARFTIAHEVAHTFFFDLSKNTPQELFTPTHPRQIDALERTCDLGAGWLLLPTSILARICASDDFFSPLYLDEAAQRYGVSLQTLLIRLHKGSWSNRHGILLFIQRHEGILTVEAAAKSNLSVPLFSHLKVGGLVPRELHDAHLTMFGGSERRVQIDVHCKLGSQDAIQPLEVRCERIRRRRTEAWLVTAELDTAQRRVDATV